MPLGVSAPGTRLGSELSSEVLQMILSWPQVVGIQWDGRDNGFRYSMGFRPVKTNFRLKPVPPASEAERAATREHIRQWLTGKFSRRTIERVLAREAAPGRRWVMGMFI